MVVRSAVRGQELVVLEADRVLRRGDALEPGGEAGHVLWLGDADGRVDDGEAVAAAPFEVVVAVVEVVAEVGTNFVDAVIGRRDPAKGTAARPAQRSAARTDLGGEEVF